MSCCKNFRELEDRALRGVFHCVVFDLDDTLYLERDYVSSGFLAVGDWAKEALHLEGVAKVAWQLFVEGRRNDIFDATLSKLNFNPDPGTILRMVEVYRQHRPQIALLPDAVECLKTLGQRFELCLITDGPVPSQRSKVEALSIQKRFSQIVFTGEWGKEYCKPNPRAFEHIESTCGVRGEMCMYIADNPLKDFIAPKERGWHAIRIRRPQGLYSELENPVGSAHLESRTLRPLVEALSAAPPLLLPEHSD